MKKLDLHLFTCYCLRWYRLYGRHDLPWRQTKDAYAILVSELMLQQTQVSRVVPKFELFMKNYPSLTQLAAASLADVLLLWQGLGYNRRARYLWQLAQQLVGAGQMNLPKTQVELEALPGVGPYTAAAVLAFAHNQPTVVLETNVRAVLLYHFFPEHEQVSDTQLHPILATCLPMVEPSSWYAALMDYGSYIKSVLPNPSRKSKHHAVQTRFQGSVRQVRGEIIRTLSQSPNYQVRSSDMKDSLHSNKEYFELALTQLCAEQLVTCSGDVLILGEKS